MRIALMAVDSEHPNLALMKISAYHKAQGDSVEWYTPFGEYDKVYMAKVFSFTPDYPYHITNATEIVKGGTGYDYTATLPEAMEYLVPDYSIYPSIDKRTAYGFLTRGCPNHCKWCVVPKKEGGIKPYMDIEQIAVDGRDHIILMDNNVLACDYGLQQIEKIIRLGLRVDFNQALDARLVTDDVAELLARVKWIKRIRFGCDTPKQIEDCQRAMDMINKHGYKGEYFLYTILTDDYEECVYRVSCWQYYPKVVVHAQPFRDIDNPNQIIPQWQKDMARWANRKELYRSCEFMDYEPRKGFKCNEYYKLLGMKI